MEGVLRAFRSQTALPPFSVCRGRLVGEFDVSTSIRAAISFLSLCNKASHVPHEGPGADTDAGLASSEVLSGLS